MKILHTSDWHLGKALYDFSLLEDQAHFIHWLLALLAQTPVDAVVISGDIYDRPVPPASAVELYDDFLSRAVGEMGIPVFAIAGNHDSASRLQFGSSLYRKSGYYVAGSISPAPHTITLRDSLGDVHFTLFPFVHLAEVRALYPGETVRTFDDAYRVLLQNYADSLDYGARNIAIAHGFFGMLGDEEAARPLLTSDSEISVGGMDIADSALFADFDYVALGHLHAPQQPCENAAYSGSPLKYSLSEERHEKSVVLVELAEKGSVRSRRIRVPALRDVRSIRGRMEELLEPSFHTCKQFDDYVFAEIEGEECTYPMQKLRTLFPKLLGLRFTAQAEAADRLIPQMQAEQRISRLSAEELFCRFFRESKGYEIPPDYLQAVRDALKDLEKEAEAL